MKDDMKPYFVGPDTPLEISESVRYVNEMRWQRDALLRVARAAKVVLPEIPHGQNLSGYELKQVIELMEALKEVEHLLE